MIDVASGIKSPFLYFLTAKLEELILFTPKVIISGSEASDIVDGKITPVYGEACSLASALKFKKLGGEYGANLATEI